MFKAGIIGGLLLFYPAIANANLNKAYFVGKWQCQIKNNDPTIKQDHELHFFKNGKVDENIRIYYGQKTAYDYQIESAILSGDWKTKDEVLIYPNYKIHTYTVRMPNSKKDDLEQATIAVEKSLPIIQLMLNNSLNQRQFDIDIIDKKNFLMNDRDNLFFFIVIKKVCCLVYFNF